MRKPSTPNIEKYNPIVPEKTYQKRDVQKTYNRTHLSTNES